MKHLVILSALLLGISCSVNAQTVDEILNNAILVKNGEKIILKLDKKNSLLYDVSNAGSGSKSALDYNPYEDKSYFLVRKNAINIYMKPVNPLNLSVNSEVSDRLDLISSESESAMKVIAGQVAQLNKIEKASSGTGAPPGDSARADKEPTCEQKFKMFIKKFDPIVKSLSIDQKKKIAEIFTKLKNLPFDTQDKTNIDLTAINDKEIAVLGKHFDELKVKFDDLQKTLTDSINCDDDDPMKFICMQVGTAAVKNIKEELGLQVKRYTALKDAYKLVNTAYTDAAVNNDNMLPWLVQIGNPVVKRGKITDFTVKVNKSGYELSADQEIQASKTEVANTYVLSFRKYDFWVPEVSAGIVYSNIDYPKFGTATDAAGKMVVATAGNDKVTKFSVTTMVNFNMYTPSSLIHPFVQLGIGANADYPAAFLGGGLKISNSLSISVGGASPWIKKLKTLQEGSVISGTADLEKDLEREFKPFSKVYACFQIKL